MTDPEVPPKTIHDGIEYSGKGTKDDPYIWEENGRTYIDNRTKWLDCKNEWLIVDNVVRALFVGFPYSALPDSVKQLVDAEMQRRHPQKA